MTEAIALGCGIAYSIGLIFWFGFVVGNMIAFEHRKINAFLFAGVTALFWPLFVAYVSYQIQTDG